MNSRAWHGSRWPEGVPFDLSYPQVPVSNLLDDAVIQYPNHPFIVFGNAVQTYRQIDAVANQVAQFLISKGIRKGDRVAMFLPNLPHFPAVFFGILRLGAVCVTCNPTYTASELRFQLQDSGARFLFVMDHPTLYATACDALRDTAVEEVVFCNAGDFFSLPVRVVGNFLSRIPRSSMHLPEHVPFLHILRAFPGTRVHVTIDPVIDLALIQYTGGTTGVPKGACMTHFNIVSNLLSIHAWVKPEDKDGQARGMEVGNECFVGVLPWYHAYGLIMTLLAGVRVASKVICVPDPRAGKPPFTEILNIIERHQATVLNGVPTLFSAIVHHPLVDNYNLRSLRLCGCGAAPLALELAREFESRTGAILYEGYGMTEAAAALTCNPTNRRDRKLGTLGMPVPGTDAIIVDMETGLHELPQGCDGEIAVSGPQIMAGYWKRPYEDEKVFRTINGKRFLLTGDIGHMDSDGFFQLVDRKKDIVIIGGYKAYPKEIEEVLYAHPKVALAAVIGIPHERLGQTLKAFVKLKDGEAASSREIIEWCKSYLAGYKVPRIIEFCDNLPVSPIGKVLKRELH